MASLLYLRPKECRAPETEVLPDSRRRLTRYFEVATTAEIPPELNYNWGDLDVFPQANLAAAWQGLRLTGRKLTDDVPRKGQDPRPMLQLVYETIAATAETPVGNVDTTKLEDGRTAKVQTYLQFSTGTYVPQTVGTLYAPYGYLLKEEAPDDGTLRRIKRSYVTSGTIKQDDTTKHNGGLLLRTVTSVQAVPATPAGYVLVEQDVQGPLGLPTYVYTFAKGLGEISRKTEYRLSVDGGTNGVTVTTVTYLSDPSVVSNPITPPSSTAMIEDGHEDLDGYRMWTGIYAKGAGTIDLGVQVKYGGALILYHRVGLGSAPTAPAPTIGGTVTSTGTDVRQDSGYTIYDYTWAEGNGEISRASEYRLSSNAGVTGMTVTTIKYLSASSVSSNPITPPSSTAMIEDGHEDLDGYRMWTGIYAKGTGTISSSITYQNKGKLVVYAITALNAAPSAPAPTIGGTVELIESSQRLDRFHQGVVIYEYRWVEGKGQVKVKVAGRGDGSLEYTVRELANGITTPAYPGSGTGYLVDLDNEAAEGHYVNTATYIKPPATVTLKKMKTFDMPGLASFSGTDLIISPPNKREIQADEEISYDVTQNTDVPFKVDYGAYLKITYVRTNNNSIAESDYKSLGYVLSGATGIGSATPSTFNGMAVDSYNAALVSSSPTSRPTGLTVIDKDNAIYLVATDGTIVYRRVKVSYTF